MRTGSIRSESLLTSTATSNDCPECTRRKNWENSYSFVASLTIRAATWLKSSRLRPGDALGWDLAGFFFSGFDAFLFPMPKVYAVRRAVQAPRISNCTTTKPAGKAG